MLRTKIFNLQFVSSSKTELLTDLQELLFAKQTELVGQTEQQHCALICTPNPEQIMLANRLPSFAKALSEADYLLPDGIGVVIGSIILNFFGRIKHAIPRRIAGVEVAEELLSLVAVRELPALIIGGRSYVEVAKHRNLHWIEAYHDKSSVLLNEEQAMASKVLLLRPVIVFVALGAPEQEVWLAEHRQLLDQAGVRLAMAVGGSFDFIFMKVARAPRALQHLGLEWLWRLAVQPWRWKRQLALLSFIGLLLSELRSESTV